MENEKREAELTDPFMGEPEEEAADKNNPILKQADRYMFLHYRIPV